MPSTTCAAPPGASKIQTSRPGTTPNTAAGLTYSCTAFLSSFSGSPEESFICRRGCRGNTGPMGAGAGQKYFCTAISFLFSGNPRKKVFFASWGVVATRSPWPAAGRTGVLQSASSAAEGCAQRGFSAAGERRACWPHGGPPSAARRPRDACGALQKERGEGQCRQVSW
jgi:hypothetical protein